MKKFLSVILAALILVCPLSGFATDAAETLEWYFCDEEDLDYCEPWVYDYKGEIALGDTEIKFTESDYSDYYTFNAENEGYYYVECNNYEIDWFGLPEKIKNGTAYGIAETYFVSGSDIEKKGVYKLDAGETVFGIDFNDEADPEDNISFKIEYLGNAVADIILDEGILDNLIIDADLYNDDSSYVNSDVGVVFSGGKTVTFPDEWVQVDDDDSNWVKGENKATVTFMGFEKSVVVTACEMKDLVTDVEFVNLDEYKDVITSYDNPSMDYVHGAEFVFTLADGKKETVNTNDDSFIEINGREFYVYAVYVFNDAEDVDIEVGIYGIEMATYECNATKLSYVEGSGRLLSDISSSIKDSSYYFRRALSEIFTMYDSGEIEESFNDSFYYFEISLIRIVNCFSLISTFFNFYF